MELIFVGVGSFLFGAFFYVMWRGNFKKIYIAFFKTKEIKQCKEKLRALDFSKIDSKQRVDVYVSKLSTFSPEIIAEAEKLYFKQKLFDDLVEYLLKMNYDINEVLIKKYKFFTILNKNHSLVKTLIEHNWKEKLIKSAFQIIEKKNKSNQKYKPKETLPNYTPEVKPERVKSDIDAPSELNLSQGVVEGQYPENIQKTQERRFFK